MERLTRRRVCRSVLALLPVPALAGCGSSSDSSESALAPSEVATVDGLEVAYTEHAVVDVIQPATASPNGANGETTPTAAGNESETAGAATPVRAGADSEILGVAFRIKNVSDAPEAAPMPRPAPPIAMAELYVRIESEEAEWEEGEITPDMIDSIPVAPPVKLNDRVVESLTYQLGQQGAELDPGEVVTGWAFYPLPAEVDLSNVRVVLSGINNETQWSLVE